MRQELPSSRRDGLQQESGEHHRKMSFQEFLALLKKHRIEYDERYLWE